MKKDVPAFYYRHAELVSASVCRKLKKMDSLQTLLTNAKR